MDFSEERNLSKPGYILEKLIFCLDFQYPMVYLQVRLLSRIHRHIYDYPNEDGIEKSCIIHIVLLPSSGGLHIPCAKHEYASCHVRSTWLVAMLWEAGLHHIRS